MSGKILLGLVGFCALAWTGTANAGMGAGLQESVVFQNLTRPTNAKFASDGRVFVTEKSGIIKVFRSVNDPTPIVFANLTTNVMDQWDRGLLGIALDPGFPNKPYVYVLYTYDAPPGKTAPVWHDACDDPLGTGCPVTARLSRLEIGPSNTMVGSEKVLIENNWCAQFPSHSIGDLAFGPDGELYVSAGEGANFDLEDYGQLGTNPCSDPVGSGGALRAQSPLTGAHWVDGAILRVDPETGAALSSNPLFGGAPDDDRIIAFGLRNPFRFNFRPGTAQIFVADVGWETIEEINRIGDAADATVENFGWPCYEGTGAAPGYGTLPLCSKLFTSASSVGIVTAPYFYYRHGAPPGPPCTNCAGASITGIAFYTGAIYPATYQNSLFFCDYAHQAIWAMLAGKNGDPDPTNVVTVNDGAPNPVSLQVGPGGDIFYVNHGGDSGVGDVRRISASSDRLPNALLTSDVTTGKAPLTVHFSAAGSSDPDGTIQGYSWDLDGDGKFGDSTAIAPAFTYTKQGAYRVQLRVTDAKGQTAVAAVTILVDNDYPQAEITTPSPSLTWKVGDVISFAGKGTDAQDGPLPASSMTWSIILMHCPSDCHVHNIQDFKGVASGKFTAPDHLYPSHLELRLTVTDSSGLQTSTSESLDPQTAMLHFATAPPGLQLAVGAASQPAPFDAEVIVGSLQSVSAPATQTLQGTSYAFVAWSDDGAASHELRADGGDATFTARYAAVSRNANADAGDDPPASAQADDGGCGCRTAGDATTHGRMAWFTLLVASVLLSCRTSARRRAGPGGPRTSFPRRGRSPRGSCR